MTFYINGQVVPTALVPSHLAYDRLLDTHSSAFAELTLDADQLSSHPVTFLPKQPRIVL